jgi:hypothetical protein
MEEALEVLIVTAHRSRKGIVVDSVVALAESQSGNGILIGHLSLSQIQY